MCRGSSHTLSLNFWFLAPNITFIMQMQSVSDILTQRVSAAINAATGQDAPAILKPSAEDRFGDYQVNGVMSLAKKLKTNPRQLAQQIVDSLDISDICEPPEIAGPGFINLRLLPDFIASRTSQLCSDDRIGVPQVSAPETVVIDYAGPNLAKEMHVGHLRSCIIGDCLARLAHFLGHNVIRQDHVGDWGTQFGMLICFLRRTQPDALLGSSTLRLADLEDFYRQAKQLFDADPDFAAESRQAVVDLQAHDPDTIKAWQLFRAESLRHASVIYSRLGLLMRPDDVRGESAYNDDLSVVVADLESLGLITISDGAACVFLDGYKKKDGSPLPVIVRKSDGGFLYATTDLAALRYRVRTLNADRVIYVTDARQKLHFQQVFEIAHLAGFAQPATQLEHVPFGSMLDRSGKPFKTREGGTVKLADLLDEATQRALVPVTAKNPDLPDDSAARIATVVGLGAVKYTDLSQNPTSDYIFDLDKMLALDGNTAPYLQYAYVRIQSIFRKGQIDPDQLRSTSADIVLEHKAELALAKHILRLPEVIYQAQAAHKPNLLCTYLYQLAGEFTGFYENCPVLNSESPTRDSRLLLCDLTARTLKLGLNLLGIDTISQM